MDINTGGSPTPKEVKETAEEVSVRRMLAPPITEHRHYYLLTREVEYEATDGRVVTEYQYQCGCGERVLG